IVSWRPSRAITPGSLLLAGAGIAIVTAASSSMAEPVTSGASATPSAAAPSSALSPAPDVCPRPPPGSPVPEPRDLRSQNGVLNLYLSIHTQTQLDGSTRYCYLLADGSQAPTLRLPPGDLLVLRLKN